jgi:hypothetical protein
MKLKEENKKQMKAEEFYCRVSEITGISHDYIEPFRYLRFDRQLGKFVETTRLRRWGNRTPGNGRFPGLGLIRYFGPTCIQMALQKPRPASKTFSDPEAAIDFLTKHLGCSTS